MEQIRLLLFILIIGAVFSVIVLFIAKFEKRIWLLKYIPATILFTAGAACFVKARWFSQGMEGLGYIVLAMLVVGGGILTLITTVVIDIFKKYNKGNEYKD